MPLRILGCILTVLFFTTSALPSSAIEMDMLAGLSARSIGPAGMSGRVAAVLGVPGDPNHILVGTATGGLWKSVDGGLSFVPLFDEQPVASIGALAFEPGNPDVIWVGTGEGNPRNSASVGNGIYRSLDGGSTWEHLGLEKSEHIHRILIDPRDPSRIFVAALGPAWSDGGERGVYRSDDGGASWVRVLGSNERTGCADLVMDPSNPNKLFAALWEYRRWPWFFESGGAGSGLFVSHDGGESWVPITQENGLPEGELGRIGLGIAASDPDLVYALIEAEENALYRSHDGGRNFEKAGDDRRAGNRPFYYGDLRIDPEWPDRIYSLWSQVSVSDDAGKSFRILVGWGQAHPDHHAMWIDPTDPQRILLGNDGGVYLSSDRGENWRFVSNLPVAQFYHIAVDMDLPYNIYGGMQDNGSWRGPSAVWENGGIRNHHWREVGFGDGFDTLPYPGDSMQGYSMSQEGFVARWNLRDGSRRSIRPAPAPDDTLRFNWNAGIAQDPFDADTIYFGSQYLHRSSDRGDTWTMISPDLTTDNPEWQLQHESGGLTPDVTGAENFTSILSIAPSPHEKGVIWVGTDDGRVHLTRDSGQNWESLERKAKGVPANSWVPHIAPSPHEPGTAFVVFEDHRRGNWDPYVFRVEEYGKRWTTLADDEIWGYCLVIEQDPVDPELLYLGTEFGLYLSFDAGKNWNKWTHGVPTVSVMDLVVHPREHDLVLGTHGRAAFVLDDIRPLREINEENLAAPLHVYSVADAIQYQVMQTGASRFPGKTEFRGANRPRGAIVSYVVNDKDLPHPDDERNKEEAIARRNELAKKSSGSKSANKAEDSLGQDEANGEDGKKTTSKLKVVITDADGEVVREFEREPHRGVNRLVWGLDRDAFEAIPSDGDDDDWGDGGGPQVLPGDYTLTLNYRDHEASTTVRVLPDPRMKRTQAEREAAWAASQRRGAVQEAISEAVTRILCHREGPGLHPGQDRGQQG